ncbi:unnamed protein product [Sphenostylis stenocarpa]|uniref:Uncharacterized protein n=1 Tax=Sphenostylis stenocarpa TaxID=92480 RepID=A0AA86S7G2_9FABA|nr:unnamed protein product [Sphenostylis stenocarpa]
MKEGRNLIEIVVDEMAFQEKNVTVKKRLKGSGFGDAATDKKEDNQRRKVIYEPNKEEFVDIFVIDLRNIVEQE